MLKKGACCQRLCYAPSVSVNAKTDFRCTRWSFLLSDSIRKPNNYVKRLMKNTDFKSDTDVEKFQCHVMLFPYALFFFFSQPATLLLLNITFFKFSDSKIE